MTNITAIETEYNGYRFRSRLEARWAYFFDLLGIRYIYEPEGYEMSDGTKYLPDFYLPDLHYYVEVKGKNEHLIADLEKIEKFVMEAKTALLILSNIPYDRASEGFFMFPIMYYEARCGGTVSHRYSFFQSYDSETFFIQDDYAICIRKYFSYEPYSREYAGDLNEYAFSAIQALPGDAVDINEEYAYDNAFRIRNTFDFSKIEQAFIKARQARFEYGETPSL